MTNRRRLVTWIGHQDLWAMGESLGGNVRKAVVQALGEPKKQEIGLGPIRALIRNIDFETIHLITNYKIHCHNNGDRIDIIAQFGQWLNRPHKLHYVQLEDPTNYEEVFRVSNGVLESISKDMHSDEKLCIHLSPGTPTMAAIWVLLAKTLYSATLYQTYKDDYREEKIPFDIQLDYVPELLKKPDRAFQEFAAASPSEIEGFERIVGESIAIKRAVHRARQAAIRDVNVLILGESGTGKEMFARAMHRANHRGAKDPKFNHFVAVNCAAIPRELLEAELFGVAEGAATQTKERQGAFELAHGGTLFLDEIGECTLEHQAKLLRALQPRPGDPPCTRWIRRIGAEDEQSFDVRVIAATNKNLFEAISQGKFRDDLYYRLATVIVRVPSLRERKTDIRFLANDILGRINRQFRNTEPGYKDKILTAAAMRRLQEHHWPGNVRELQNVLVQAAVMCANGDIGESDIEAAIAEHTIPSAQEPFSRVRGENFSLKKRLLEIEAIYIADALKEAGNNQTRAAELLGLKQQTLSKKIKTLKQRKLL